MVLEEDVNGFRAAGQKKKGGKGKGRKVHGLRHTFFFSILTIIQHKNQPVVAVWDPTEPYDLPKAKRLQRVQSLEAEGKDRETGTFG